MKKILLSVAIIGAVAAIVIGATTAYFSDTETSTGNTFTAGTIDIAIDGTNPWTGKYNIGDLKPGETGNINFDIQNVGTNPVNVSKNLSNWNESTGSTGYPCANAGDVSSEPECVAAQANSNVDKNDVQSQLVYDLSVKVYRNAGESNLIWWQAIYTDADGKSISQIYPNANTYVALGMIPVGGHMKVTQSYHFNANAGNEYQGDALSFDITIKGDQLLQANGATVTLENKGGAPDWKILDGNDGINGVLTYNTMGATFDYAFSAHVTQNGAYTLIYPGPSGDYPCVGSKVIGSGIASGGAINFNGSVDLGSIANGKVWLVPSADYNGTIMTNWHNDQNLYETALINYTKN